MKMALWAGSVAATPPLIVRRSPNNRGVMTVDHVFPTGPSGEQFLRGQELRPPSASLYGPLRDLNKKPYCAGPLCPTRSEVFLFLTGGGTTIPMGRLFRCTVRRGAESLARFGPPGFRLGTPSPGSAPGPGLTLGRCSAAAVPCSAAVPSSVRCSALGPMLCRCRAAVPGGC